MNKQFTWKVLLIVAVAAISGWAIHNYGIQLGLDLKGGTSYLLKVDLSQIETAGRGQAVKQAIEILGKRVNRFGVAEPIIQAVGTDRILVQIPGLKEQDRAEARSLIQKTAKLEFRLVHADNDTLQREATSPYFRAPLGYTNLTETVVREGRSETRSYFCKTTPEQGLTGTYVERAFVDYDNLGRPHISMEFNKEGAALFAKVTRVNVGRQLAIVLDGQLQSAPVIQDEILGGRAQISGSFSLAEAQNLASVLENPLQAPVTILEDRGVDPSLGKDSINSGVRAAVFGAAAVVIFMAVYYLAAGLVANLALILNILILIGVLAMFKFTLTLPGIAGIVLTIGMAVDANVLIFERIREELAAKKGLKVAIVAGYQRAFVVIFDSNFTTIMAAIILIMLGSGPIKGFGVTLTVGLIANLFAAVFVTRVGFDWLIGKGWMKSFKMFHIFNVIPKINFLGVWKMAFILSWLIIAVGVYSFVQRGGMNVGKGEVYGIDFAGGDSLTMSFAQRVDVDKLRAALEATGFKEAYIQYSKGTERDELVLRLPENSGEKVYAMLQTSFPEAGFKEPSVEHVGATIGQELLTEASWAVLVALGAIMIYVAFRFGEFAYGLGALIALAHDVLMCVGIFCLAGVGHTFSLPVVAALLTIIGYSINNVIVVFDRIRENRKLASTRLSYHELINRSINEMLPRTILTAGTTLVTALALMLFGGRVIYDFAFIFLVGVLVGTYSSIYIASPIVLWYHRDEGKSANPAPAKSVAAKA
ncbi:MAG: Protein translocase subunit SecDF [Verrucomicrobiae bacterium]|nr:Protein translocase subunit SecDF [Verrucomicrobiae bacterium]